MKKLFVFVFLIAISFNSAFSYEWPQENVNSESFSSYFGQNRGGLMSTSLVFKDSEEVKACETGRVLIVMEDLTDDSDFFPSTLGASVIIAHEDNLVSVYGNLDRDSININDNNYVEKGSILAAAGNSGWQDVQSGLEFQIIDFQNDSAINPKVLLSRIDKELPLTLNGVVLNNKHNDYFDLNTTKIYPSGLYRIYRQRNAIANPYKTTVLVNGIQLDQLSYDVLYEENNFVCVNGKRKYTASELYPDDKLQLLGEVMLSPGKSTLELTVADFLNNTKHVFYNVSIY